MNRLRGCLLALMMLGPAVSFGQDRLVSWPVYQRMRKDLEDEVGLPQLGNIATKWIDASRLSYQKDGAWHVVDLPSGRDKKVDKEPQQQEGTTTPNPNTRRRRPGRGGLFEESLSADGKVRVFYKDANVWLDKGGKPVALTTDGDPAKRIRYGKASWVYGEELGQLEAMGVSPDGSKAWFYRFDEGKVLDNMVVFQQATPQPVFQPQAYPKPGHDNPVVDLFVVDTTTLKTVRVDARPGLFEESVGHYLYDIQWSPDGKELFFRRTDRRQKTMEFCAADPATGRVRVVVREEWPQTYTENKLGVWFFDTMPDSKGSPSLAGQALWEHQRNGFLNLGVLDLGSGKLRPVTDNHFDETRVVRVDLKSRVLYYMGRGAGDSYKDQLFVAKLDGSGNRRVTDPRFHHSVRLSPDGRWAVDVAETVQDPPVTRVIDMNGKVLAEIERSDLSKFTAAGYQMPERVEFLSPDGSTKLCGVLHKPRNFDPSKKYPLLVRVYGGPLDPHWSGFSETFRPYDTDCGLGFVTATFDNRGTGGRGKPFSDPLYRHMGLIEIDDQAAGTAAVIAKGYVDPSKVCITGGSYGGYASVMCLLRHPEVFKAAVACSSPTDWRNYDTIYTERYMGLLGESTPEYDAGSAMTYADKLTGWLMLYYGTADENVHPCNTLQLLKKLAGLGKTVEVQVGTDAGHSSVDDRRMFEFFFDRLNISKE